MIFNVTNELHVDHVTNELHVDHVTNWIAKKTDFFY